MSDLGLIPPIIVLLCIALLARLMQRSWFAPGAYFTLFWVTEVARSFVVPEWSVWSGAIWWIALTCMVFNLATVLGALLVRLPKVTQSVDEPLRLVMRHAVLCLIVISLAGGLYTTLVELSGVDVGGGGERLPLAYQFLLPFHFAGPAIGGLVFASRNLVGRRQWLTLLPLLPPGAIAILFTGRTAIVGPIIFWCAGWLVGELLMRRGRVPVLTARRVLVAAILVPFLIALGSYIYALRVARAPTAGVEDKLAAYTSLGLDWDSFTFGWRTVRTSVFGGVYSFSYYFTDAWVNPPEPTWGGIIFAGPLTLFELGGIRYPWEPFEMAPGVTSNIFTMLRGPMDDFGFVGSLPALGRASFRWCIAPITSR